MRHALPQLIALLVLVAAVPGFAGATAVPDHAQSDDAGPPEHVDLPEEAAVDEVPEDVAVPDGVTVEDGELLLPADAVSGDGAVDLVALGVSEETAETFADAIEQATDEAVIEDGTLLLPADVVAADGAVDLKALGLSDDAIEAIEQRANAPPAHATDGGVVQPAQADDDGDEPSADRGLGVPDVVADLVPF